MQPAPGEMHHLISHGTGGTLQRKVSAYLLRTKQVFQIQQLVILMKEVTE